METKPIEDLLEENEEALKTVDKAIEGLLHMDEQQDLRDVTERAVHELKTRYENRRALQQTLAQWASGTKDAIEALLAEGYPEEPMPEVSPDVTDDLDQNTDTINYARSRFKVRQLTTSATFTARPQQAPSG
ncbi:MAG: hypothetical protein LC776_01395 [Acidobacteria bacterium]|nr:hypothetical protein [Acidobacteriota bacterium]